jgi:hypothetical protein
MQHRFFKFITVLLTAFFYEAPAPIKIFDAAPVPAAPGPAQALTLLYTKPSFWKQTIVNLWVGATFSSDFCMIKKVTNMNGKSKKL